MTKNTMKIAILTLPLHTNYGGILQAYALQIVLERIGHDVVIIDRMQHKNEPSVLTYLKRIILKYLLRRNIRIFVEKKYNKSYPYVSKNTQKFIDRYIHHVFTQPEYIKEKDFDAYVVGSDQIWRPSYYSPIQNAYLRFTKGWNVKRIAYAASFGTDAWEYSPKQEKDCRELIQGFDAVSVREQSGVQLCKKHFGINACHVLDPTLLLNAEDYIKLGVKEDSQEQIVTYILDDEPNTKETIEYISKKMDLPIHRANSRFEEYSAPIEERVQPAVESWLSDLYNAKIVLTDSFHACVFSILFKKDFLVIGNTSRGQTRVLSLLHSLNLDDRLICSLDSCDHVINKRIDYFKIDALVDKLKNESLCFLRNNL